MPKQYPLLKLSEIKEIVKRLNLVEDTSGGGSHSQWLGFVNGKKVRVTVDNAIDDFDPYLIQSMHEQANISRKEFYSLSKSACRKLNLKHKKSL